MAVRFYKSVPVEFEDGLCTKKYAEGSCSSTDTKPTEGIAEGSSLTETDTGNVYLYNETNGWTKMFCIKAGGSDAES